jgi:hypothetical protein
MRKGITGIEILLGLGEHGQEDGFAVQKWLTNNWLLILDNVRPSLDIQEI